MTFFERCAFLCLVGCGLAVVEAYNKDGLAAEDVCSGSADAACALNELQSRVADKQASKDTSAATSAVEDASCILEAKPKQFPPHMIPGDKTNIRYGNGHEGLDLDGVWWIRWPLRPSSFWPSAITNWLQTMFYNSIQLEMMFSFAGGFTTGDGYPTIFSMPEGEKKQWAYGANRVSGRYWMWMYGPAARMQGGHLNWTFTDASFGYDNAAFPKYTLIKEEDDVWARPTNWPENPPPAGGGPTLMTWTYKMTRIVDGSGKKTKFWDDWVKEGANYRVWNVHSDKECIRDISSWAAIFGSISSACSKAKAQCGNN